MYKIFFVFLLLILSSCSYAEVTGPGVWAYQGEDGRWYFNTQIQERVIPTKKSRARAPTTGALVQTRNRGLVNYNPASERTAVIQSRGGEAATHRCGGAIEIASTSGRCENKEYDKDFLTFLNNQGFRCAQEAGRQAFGFTPTKIKLFTGFGQVKRGRRSSNGKYSTHSAGRALDIFNVEIYNGAAHSSVKMHRSYMDRRGHRVFYTQFRDCWKRAVRAEHGGLAGTYGSGCIDFSDASHRDHMHISLPPKDENRRRYNLNST